MKIFKRIIKYLPEELITIEKKITNIFRMPILVKLGNKVPVVEMYMHQHDDVFCRLAIDGISEGSFSTSNIVEANDGNKYMFDISVSYRVRKL